MHVQNLTYCVKRALLTGLCKKHTFLPIRPLSNSNAKHAKLVLGIETSCDDTGAAVMDDTGRVLGNALHSQTATTVALGGVLPPHAKALHQKYIGEVITGALNEANITAKDLDAVAVTVEPGLPLSLDVGIRHAKKLVQEHRLPMIPIHHMEAHALTARSIQRLDFPFLVFLISGGHCLLAVARDIDDFLLLGSSLDTAPGEAFDKVARRMKLKSLPECADMCGGAMIEMLAKTGDRDAFPETHVLLRNPSCNFSFAGIKSNYNRIIEREEEKQGIVGSGVISNVSDVCAAFQYAILRHMARRLQRAFLYCEMYHMLPEHKTLVVSGGVACNEYLRTGLQKVCDEYNARLVAPPPHLCTDNGIMIAWNGMEKLLAGRPFAEDPQNVDLRPKSPLGKDISHEVALATIKPARIKL